MKRPSIPFKPPAPSIHPVARRLAERDRPLKLGSRKQTAELVADIERELGLAAGALDDNSGEEREGPAL